MICDVIGVVQYMYLSKTSRGIAAITFTFEAFWVTLVNENIGNRAVTK